MNSSTSVFKCAEARVVAAIAVFLLMLELFFSFAGRGLSEDVRNIEKIASDAEALGESEAPRVVFVGNSILNAGIDPERFRDEIVAEGGDPELSLSLAYPDSSEVVIWDYLLRRYYVEPGRIPEDVILVTGRSHLLDTPADPIAMGAYYVSNRDVMGYLKADAGSYDNGVAFFLGRGSAAMRSRKRVAPRVFDAVLPYYQENWNILHRAKIGGDPAGEAKSKAPGEEGEEPTKATTHHLEGILSLLKDKGVRVTVVVAPGIRDYELDAEVAAVLERNGVRVVDLSAIPGLGADGFSDPDHVNAEGRKLFTDALARELAGYWKR